MSGQRRDIEALQSQLATRFCRVAVPMCVLCTYRLSSVSSFSHRTHCARQQTYLRRKLQTRQRLAQMRLQRRNHDKHERLRISTQRMLEQICQLRRMLVSTTTHNTSSALINSTNKHTLLFRYGTCPPSLPCPNAAMTSPKQLRLLLILCVSFSLSPVA